MLGFTPYHFHILCCLSSWATCGSRKEPPSETRDSSEQSGSAYQDSRIPTTETGTRGPGGTPDENTECSSEIKDVHEHNTTEADEGSCIKYVYCNDQFSIMDRILTRS